MYDVQYESAAVPHGHFNCSNIAWCTVSSRLDFEIAPSSFTVLCFRVSCVPLMYLCAPAVVFWGFMVSGHANLLILFWNFPFFTGYFFYMNLKISLYILLFYKQTSIYLPKKIQMLTASKINLINKADIINTAQVMSQLIIMFLYPKKIHVFCNDVVNLKGYGQLIHTISLQNTQLP